MIGCEVIDPEKGEQTAQACANAWLRQPRASCRVPRQVNAALPENPIVSFFLGCHSLGLFREKWLTLTITEQSLQTRFSPCLAAVACSTPAADATPSKDSRLTISRLGISCADSVELSPKLDCVPQEENASKVLFQYKAVRDYDTKEMPGMDRDALAREVPTHEGETKSQPSSPSRRSFLGKASGLSAAVVVSTLVPLEPLLDGKGSTAEASVIPYAHRARANASFSYRGATAAAEYIDLGVLPDNGDAARFSDHSGSWSKALLHDSVGMVNQNAWASFVTALSTGRFSDFQNIIVGNPAGTNFTGTLNGPLAALAFDLEGHDSHATVIPPAPCVSSAQTATEAVEHYWGALIRDVPFIQYDSNRLVAQAVADMNNLSFAKSAANNYIPYPVTPDNLFRGQVYPGDGNVQGPYLSQLMLQPTYFGAQPMNQLLQDFLPGQDFLTDPAEFLRVQNGQVPSASLAFDPTFRYLRCGRSLAAYTHVDALHQAYFTAALILLGINAPLNPGNPYIGSKSQHGFGTLGGPDILGTIPEMATRALKAAWFHKWIINLRPRPEEYGGLVFTNATKVQPCAQAAGTIHPDVLNSAGLAASYSQFGSYLLPQAFPEAAPAHPCYPAGHGTVGGACVAALKFFFDGTQPIRPLLLAAGSDVMQPSADGTQLLPYTGADRDSLTITGELSKLAYNVTFGHGIHAGIHFRSSSHFAVLLGEQVGISVLQDRARSYNEPFNVTIRRFDGTTATIQNPGKP